jgi:mono/diheme cytochrome c family protein
MNVSDFLKKIFFAAGLIFCCCSPSILLPTTADTAAANKRWAEADSVSLYHGYQLYVNKCGSCHTLHRPSKFTEDKWKKEVPEMGAKAHLTPAECEMILRYVLTRREVMLAQKNTAGG